jgi:hypothetical protein
LIGFKNGFCIVGSKLSIWEIDDKLNLLNRVYTLPAPITCLLSQTQIVSNLHDIPFITESDEAFSLSLASDEEVTPQSVDLADWIYVSEEKSREDEMRGST